MGKTDVGINSNIEFTYDDCADACGSTICAYANRNGTHEKLLIHKRYILTE